MQILGQNFLIRPFHLPQFIIIIDQGYDVIKTSKDQNHRAYFIGAYKTSPK